MCVTGKRKKKNAVRGRSCRLLLITLLSAYLWLNVCVHVHIFILCVCGGHTALVASTELRQSPLRAWAGDHDLGKCHPAHGGGSPVSHKAVVAERISALYHSGSSLAV